MRPAAATGAPPARQSAASASACAGARRASAGSWASASSAGTASAATRTARAPAAAFARPLVLDRLRHRGPQHEADRREVVPGDVEDQLEQVAGELRLGVEQALDRPDAGDLRLIREAHDVADVAAAPQRDQDPLAGADRAAQVLRDAELQRFGEREAQRDVGIAGGHGSTIVS